MAFIGKSAFVSGLSIFSSVNLNHESHLNHGHGFRSGVSLEPSRASSLGVVPSITALSMRKRETDTDIFGSSRRSLFSFFENKEPGLENRESGHRGRSPSSLKLLSPEAIQALLNASQSFHSVDALEKDGRLLVVLGESHIKPVSAAKAGEAVLQHCPIRLLEGAALPGYEIVDPKKSTADFSENDDKAKIGGLWGIYFGLIENIDKLSFGMLQGSTIQVACEQKNDVIRGRKVENIPMELGHESSPQEIATFKVLPLLVAVSGLVNYAFQIQDSLPDDVRELIIAAHAFLMTQNLVACFDTFTGGSLSDNPIGPLVNPISGILHGRSKTMAANIDSCVQKNRNRKMPVLAIMGVAHVKKVLETLITQEGYKKIALTNAGKTV